MKGLEGNQITFDGTTYEMTSNGALVDGELHVDATSPRGEDAILIYRPKRSVNADIPTNYELDGNELELGETSHRVIVDSDELDYSNIYTLEELN